MTSASSRTSTARSGGGDRDSIRRNALHRFVEDLQTLETMTNADSARRWLSRGSAATPRGGPSISSPSPPTRRRCGVRDRHAEHVRILGLVGGPIRWTRRSALDDDRRRSRELSRSFARFTDGRALPHRPFEKNLPVLSAAHGLVHGFLSAPRRWHLPTRVPEALSRVPAAADDGEQRQARQREGTEVNYATGPSTGESGNERAALFLPAESTKGPSHPCDFIAFAKG